MFVFTKNTKLVRFTSTRIIAQLKMETKKEKVAEKRSKKRQRDIDSRLIDRFWDLAEASDEKRIKGAEILLNVIAEHQQPVIHRKHAGFAHVRTATSATDLFLCVVVKVYCCRP